jgi:hypothetical protein
MVGHVQHDHIEPLLSGIRHVLRDLFNKAFEMRVCWAVCPCLSSTLKVSKSGGRVFWSWFDGDVVSVWPEGSGDVQSEACAPKTGFQHHVVPANPKPRDEDSCIFVADGLCTAKHASP